MSFATLPKEILLQICHLLRFRKSALLEMQLTCRQWSQITREFFYTAVTIRNQSRAELFVRTIASANESITHVVRDVEFSNPTSNTGSQVKALARACPNLRSIRESRHTGLRDGDYLDLVDLHQQGYLQKLEDIYIPNKYQITDLPASYTQLMIAARRSITTLCISKNSSTLILAGCMKDFVNLRKVYIGNNGITLEELWSLLSEQHANITEISVETVNTTMLTRLTMQELREHIKPMPQVNDISLDFVTITDRDMVLIKHMFPSVKCLQITCRSRPALVGTDGLSEAGINTFFSYSNQLSSLRFGVLEMTSQVLLSTLSKVKDFAVQRIDIDTSANQSAGNHQFRFSSWDDWEDTEEGLTQELTLHLKIDSNQMTVAFCNHLLTLLKNFMNITVIRITGEKNGGHYQKHKILAQLVNHALATSKHLKLLILESLPLTSLPAANESSKKLQMNLVELLDCQIPPDFLLQLSQRVNQMGTLGFVDLKEVDAITGIPRVVMAVNMPFTKFHQMDPCNADAPIIYKLCLDSRIIYCHVDSEGEATRINADRYAQLIATEETEFVIQCAALEILQTEHGPVYESNDRTAY